MKLYFDYGLPFAEIDLVQSEKSVTLSKVLIDTGSATTIISTETAIELGLAQQPDDEISIVRGIGGIESVYEKHIERIAFESLAVNNFKVDVGAMLYGFDLDAIIGSDFLKQTKAIVNFDEMTLTPAT
jgi:predicted aspartyl protease